MRLARGENAIDRSDASAIERERNTHLHPPFFSMLFWHFGHMRVLALIHCEVPASSRALFSHLGTSAQITGRWSASCPHPKQNACPRLQRTVGTSVRSASRRAPVQWTVSVHPGFGQKRKFEFAVTYDCSRSSLYLQKTRGEYEIR